MAKKAKKKSRTARKPKSDPSPDDLEFQWKLKLKKEPLRPDLRKFLDQYGPLGATLRHPLLVQQGVDEERAAWINWFIDYKQKKMERLREKGDWFGVLGGYETAFLVHGFVKEIEHFDDATYWKALAEVWTMQEQLWPNRKLLLDLLRSPRPKRDKLMTTSELRSHAKLPDTVNIHRGYVGQRGKGLSWTIDEDKAIWFAKRFAMIEGQGKPRLISGVAKKIDVLAYFTRREEAEIVIDPEKVKRQKKTEL